LEVLRLAVAQLVPELVNSAETWEDRETMLKQLDAFFEASKMFVREQLGGERFACERIGNA
jgi:hypothetical protein